MFYYYFKTNKNKFYDINFYVAYKYINELNIENIKL